MIKILLLDLKNIKLVEDHIHRLPKPSLLFESVPRDVILCIHFFHMKEQLMQKTRTLGTLPNPYFQLQIFENLS